MFRNIISFKCVVILIFFTFIAGCGDSDKDEIESLKKELAEIRLDLNYWQGKYDAVCIDNKKLRAAHRSIDTRLEDIDESAMSVEEQLYYAKQFMQELQIEIEERDATIEKMELIIEDQEAALKEFLELLGINTEEQIQAGY